MSRMQRLRCCAGMEWMAAGTRACVYVCFFQVLDERRSYCFYYACGIRVHRARLLPYIFLLKLSRLFSGSRV